MKPHLVEMVMKQQDCWPDEKFSPSKTTVARLKHVLLTVGFTKESRLVEVEGATAQPDMAATEEVLRDGDALSTGA
jgi:hypothetical protein